MDNRKILIVDDEKPTREVMARILSASYECLLAPDAELAMDALDRNPDIALLITDYKMPGKNGVELIKKTKENHPSVACILVTAFGEIELAVAAMKDGADDFLTKPITDIAQMEQRVAKAIEKNALSRKVEELQREIDIRKGIDTFTGDSPAMERIYKLIRQSAKANASVLIEGPSGTGKELVAKALHDLSPRAGGPFVAVECAALSPTLIESELFGHEKGAFTGAEKLKIGKFEAASGGTLFLDEITEIDLATQVKLLRVLESRTLQRVGGNDDIKVDFRLVAATNRDLAEYVRAGKFREDLYYRLNVIDIRLPALRDRPGDIALLVSRFIKEFAGKNDIAIKGIDAAAVKILESYSWPGNVRQLRNVIERMVVLSDGARLTVGDIPDEILAAGVTALAAPSSAPPAAVPDAVAPTREAEPRTSLADAEKTAILKALEECAWNKTRAAGKLGISRRTLHRKLNEWRIEK
jgi:DNA-binding NtrC family response regulator